MRLLVCGDRKWNDLAMIADEIKQLAPTIVIEGEARGADTLASIVATGLGIDVWRFPANWEKHGRAAGYIRNQAMLTEGKPDMVLAFHDNIEASKGTKDMVNRARKAGVPVTVISHK